MTDRRPLVLIVDDTPTNIHVLAQALKDDYRVKVATNGALALELCHQTERPDLVLLDVMMPGMDGYEVCRRLKDNPDTQRIPIIFVTALGAASDEARGLNLGAADYVSKPFYLPVVRARIRNHIALKRNADLLESLAYIDGLTRLANRRHFERALEAEWNRAYRTGSELAVLFADIDDFKKLNDHFGHGHGDVCLCEVAEAFSESLSRPGDVPARYGGEEFVALLPDTGLDGVREVAERLRQAIEALGIGQAPEASFPVITVSIGIAAARPAAEGDGTVLVGAADAALYRAKKSGRNRVCS